MTVDLRIKPGKKVCTSISTASKEIYSLGKNIASTKGKVIYQNELMQLICYEPKSQVHSVPILVMPPWINKYYILDLTKENSFIKFLVDKGYQVYLVSWVNPGPELAHKDFVDYFKEGIDEPIKFLKNKFNYKKFNLIGYCLGGTLSASACAYYEAKKQDNIASITMLATLLDFSDPGDLALFINDHTIGAIKDESQKVGYFSGKYMSHAFSLLKANELIWSFVINNYLMGKKPIAFDLLYWNADSTNLPAKMHDFYLDNMYIKNNLIKDGGIQIENTPINLADINVPSFFLSTMEDHIAPWESTFSGAKVFGSNSKHKPIFCLAGSGHIAGVINPPSSKKYSYFTARESSPGVVELPDLLSSRTKRYAPGLDSSSPSHHLDSRTVSVNDKNGVSPNDWLNNALEHNGSWWNYWEKWLGEQSGAKQDSIKYAELEYLELAPGSYVKVRVV